MPTVARTKRPRGVAAAKTPARELIQGWRERAAALERYAPEVARAVSECADELEAMIRRVGEITVTPTEIVELSGYGARAVGKMLAEQRLPNVGNRRRPRVPLAAVPKKPGHQAHELDYDVLAISARHG